MVHLKAKSVFIVLYNYFIVQIFDRYIYCISDFYKTGQIEDKWTVAMKINKWHHYINLLYTLDKNIYKLFYNLLLVIF